MKSGGTDHIRRKVISFKHFLNTLIYFHDNTTSPHEISTRTTLQVNHLLVGAPIATATSSRSRDRFRAVFETVVDGIIIIDRRGTIQLLNPSAERIFGFSMQEVVGMNVNTLMPEPYRTQHDGYLKNYQETGRKKIIGIGRQVQGQRKDRSIFPMELAVGQIQDDDEWAYVGIVRDVTEREAAVVELSKARAKAESANKAKTDFLAQMSHELRTPLNAIMGYSQLLRMNGQDTFSATQRDDYLDSVIKSATHLNALIEDVLELAKIEVGRHKILLEAVNLGAIVSEAIMMTRAMATRFGVSILSKGLEPHTWPTVQTDPMRLRQCIVNLLSNAIKYNRPRGRILIDFVPMDTGDIRLMIEDTGPGIPSDKIGQLFQPFTRLSDRQESIEGSGIGLSITKRLIEAMGGSISIDSILDTGTTVALVIPLAAEDMNPLITDMPTPCATTPSSPIRTEQAADRRVLYVEDTSTNVRLMEAFFASLQGWQLTIATSAETGLEIARNEDFDYLILDVMLPGMDGFEAISKFRALPHIKSKPIIGLSARASNEDRATALSLGFDHYLSKPFEFAQLASLLGQLPAL
jgi:PAS domain S-box-containing protein